MGQHWNRLRLRMGDPVVMVKRNGSCSIMVRGSHQHACLLVLFLGAAGNVRCTKESNQGVKEILKQSRGLLLQRRSQCHCDRLAGALK